MVQYLYLGRVGYEEGLRLQAEIAALVTEGRLKNVLLMLEHPPVLTLGRNARRTNVLASDELLAARCVALHEINRGGDVTYHGPGQLVGYPIFDLRTIRKPNGARMGPVDFVRGMEEALIQVCAVYGVMAARLAGLTGVWVGTGIREQGSGNEETGPGTKAPGTVEHPAGPERKIAAIGIHVSKGITTHGFALNVTTDLQNFELIVPCGIPDHAVTSLSLEVGPSVEIPALESVAHQAARQFGMVLGEHVLAVESLQALRSIAAAEAREFPAPDTPVRVPAEVKRLRGVGAGPVRA